MTVDFASRRPSVVNGVLNRTSASAIDKANDCLRWWHIQDVLGVRGEKAKSAILGDEVHKQIERFILTGEDTRGPIARELDLWTPRPRTPGIVVERRITAGMVEVGGVPFVGKIDIQNRSGSYIDPQGETLPLLRGSEILDWKTTSDMARMVPPEGLPRNVQMAAYGLHDMFETGEDIVRLSHATTCTTKREARKTTIVVGGEDILPALDYAAGVVRTMQDAAREIDPNKVPANPLACDKYGGCPHHERKGGLCRLSFTDTLSKIVGATMSGAILGTVVPLAGANPLAAFLPPAAPAAPVAPALPPGVDPTFAANVELIFSAGRGMPQFTGEAARQRRLLIGQAPTTDRLQGSGELAPLEIDVPARAGEFVSLMEKQGWIRVAGPPAVPPAPPALNPALPPDAPASNPALAAVPVPGWSPPGAPAAVEPPAAAPEAAPKKRGRPPKAKPEAALEVALSASPIPDSLGGGKAPGTVTVTQVAEATDGGHPHGCVDLYVDCHPRGVALQPFSTVVDQLCAAVCKGYAINDIRKAPKGTPLEYGGWKGFLAGMAREALAAGQIPAGAYYADSRNELVSIVVDALEPVADSYIRGVR